MLGISSAGTRPVITTLLSLSAGDLVGDRLRHAAAAYQVKSDLGIRLQQAGCRHDGFARLHCADIAGKHDGKALGNIFGYAIRRLDWAEG